MGYNFEFYRKYLKKYLHALIFIRQTYTPLAVLIITLFTFTPVFSAEETVYENEVLACDYYTSPNFLATVYLNNNSIIHFFKNGNMKYFRTPSFEKSWDYNGKEIYKERLSVTIPNKWIYIEDTAAYKTKSSDKNFENMEKNINRLISDKMQDCIIIFDSFTVENNFDTENLIFKTEASGIRYGYDANIIIIFGKSSGFIFPESFKIEYNPFKDKERYGQMFVKYKHDGNWEINENCDEFYNSAKYQKIRKLKKKATAKFQFKGGRECKFIFARDFIFKYDFVIDIEYEHKICRYGFDDAKLAFVILAFDYKNDMDAIQTVENKNLLDWENLWVYYKDFFIAYDYPSATKKKILYGNYEIIEETKYLLSDYDLTEIIYSGSDRKNGRYRYYDKTGNLIMEARVDEESSIPRMPMRVKYYDFWIKSELISKDTLIEKVYDKQKKIAYQHKIENYNIKNGNIDRILIGHLTNISKNKLVVAVRYQYQYVDLDYDIYNLNKTEAVMKKFNSIISNFYPKKQTSNPVKILFKTRKDKNEFVFGEFIDILE